MPFYYTLYHQQYAWAFALFMLAGFSDGLDGFLARKLNCISQFGAIADPIADKLLTLSSFVILYYLQKVPYWLVFIVIFKDVYVVSGVIMLRFKLGQINYASTHMSKVNTALQIAFIAYALFELAYFNVIPEPWLDLACLLLVATSLLTMVTYTWSASQLLTREVQA